MAVTITLVDGSQIIDHSITAEQIETKTITNTEIADKTISSGQIQNGSLITEVFADGSVTAIKLANKTITSDQIAIDTITANEITNGTITDLEVAAGAGIKTSKLEEGALFVKKDGTSGALVADLDMGGNQIINLGAPSTDTDATNKLYVDTALSNALTSALAYKGTWDPASGMPISPKRGDYWKVGVDGTATINGTVGVEVKLNDAIVFNGTDWDKIDNTENYTAGNGLALNVFDFSIKHADDTLISTVAGLKLNYSKFVTKENMASQINGTTRTFVLANAPEPGTEQIFMNGLLMNGETTSSASPPAIINEDYAINYTTRTFYLNTQIRVPRVDREKILINYFKKIV